MVYQTPQTLYLYNTMNFQDEVYIKTTFRILNKQSQQFSVMRSSMNPETDEGHDVPDERFWLYTALSALMKVADCDDLDIKVTLDAFNMSVDSSFDPTGALNTMATMTQTKDPETVDLILCTMTDANFEAAVKFSKHLPIMSQRAIVSAVLRICVPPPDTYEETTFPPFPRNLTTSDLTARKRGKLSSQEYKKAVIGYNKSKSSGMPKGPKYEAAAVWGYRYGAADSPDAVNNYLMSVMNPFGVADVAIPDLDMTSFSFQNTEINHVKTWTADSMAQLMIVFTPASASYPITIYAKAPGDIWGYLGSISSDDPLSANFRSQRLVSGGLAIRAGAVSGTNFNLAGNLNTSRMVSFPPLNLLDYNTLVSYASDSGSVIRQATAEEGIVMLWRPNGPHIPRVPETPGIIPYADTAYAYSADGGNVSVGPGGAGFSPLVLTEITDLPSPYVGKVKVRASLRVQMLTPDMPFTVPPTISSFTIQLLSTVAIPVVWTSNVVVQGSDTQTIIPLASNLGNLTYHFEIPWTDVTNLTSVRLSSNVYYDTASNTSFDWVSSIEVLMPEYYADNHLQPADVAILTGFTEGTPVNVSAAMNYEVVADANLSRYVRSSVEVEDPMAMELAEAYLKRVGDGVFMHYTNPSYSDFISGGSLPYRLTGKALYSAASKPLKTRLAQAWNFVSPYVGEIARSGLMGAVTAAGSLAGPQGEIIASGLNRRIMKSGNRYEAADNPSYSEVIGIQPPPLATKNPVISLLRSGGNMSAGGNLLSGVPRMTTNSPQRIAHFALVPTEASDPAMMGSIVFGPIDLLPQQLKTLEEGMENVRLTPLLTMGSTTISVENTLMSDVNAAFWSIMKELIVSNQSSFGAGTFAFVPGRFYDFTGRSWQLAAVMALAGLSTPSVVYTGTIEQNGSVLYVGSVARVAEKLVLCQKMGKHLIAPMGSEVADVTITTEMSLLFGGPNTSSPVTLVTSVSGAAVASARFEKAGFARTAQLQRFDTRKQSNVEHLPEFEESLDSFDKLIHQLQQEFGLGANAVVSSFVRSSSRYREMADTAGPKALLQAQAGLDRLIRAAETLVVQQTEKMQVKTPSEEKGVFGQGMSKSSIARRKKRAAMGFQPGQSKTGFVPKPMGEGKAAGAAKKRVEKSAFGEGSEATFADFFT